MGAAAATRTRCRAGPGAFRASGDDVRRFHYAVAAGLAVLSLTACQVSVATAGHSPSPGASARGPVPLPSGNPPGPWRLRFDDEFTGRSLARNHWSTGWLAGGITPPVNRAELECYDPAQVSESGGQLRLGLARKRESCGKTRPYAAGMVNTAGKFEFRYGFVEARSWLPGRGKRISDWPAFWADGHHWPESGEIDVMEGLAGKACWHLIYVGANPGGCARGAFANGWHTFGADWEPGVITYYYDGRVVGRLRRGVPAARMYLILNLAAARAHGGPVRVPAAMRVDYVRVWQRPG